MNGVGVIHADESAPQVASSGKGKTPWLITLLKGVVSCGLMYWVLQGTNLKEIFASMQEANLLLLIGAFSLSFFGYFISVSRWKILLQAHGVSAQVFFLVKSFMVSVFFNNFLPSTVGGDVIRAYDSYRLGVTKAQAATVVFVDRFLGLLALLSLALVGVLIAPQVMANSTTLDLWILGAVFLMGFLVWNIFFSSGGLSRIMDKVLSICPFPIQRFGQKVVGGFHCFQGRGDTLGQALGLSLLLQVNVVLQYFLIAQALNFQVELGAFFLVIPVSLVMMLLPVSINGIGIREGIFVLLFSPLGVVKGQVLALAWIAYGFLLVQGFLGGMVYALRKNRA
jgi:uncharacterized protein (TIRG00374 family)